MSGAAGHQRQEELLKEQLDFLRTSADAFDAGVLHEYKRIALVLRVLLHDTSQSHSLLEQLGVKAKLRFWDTRQDLVAVPGFQALAAHDEPHGMLVMRATLTTSPDPRGEGAWRHDPALGQDGGQQPPSRKEFLPWWLDPILQPKSGEAFARRDFVLGPANKEGGAHVDPEPPVSWVVLRDTAWDHPSGNVDARGQVLPMYDLVPAVVRQIGYEVLETLAEQT